MIIALGVGLVLRLAMLVYGLWQDTHMAVKYTDVDYMVFCDATTFAYNGESPYKRATYRYTPLLAWMLLPNLYLTELYGKILFVVFDLLTGVLIHKILTQQNVDKHRVSVSTWMWFLNPFAANICTRGNAESIMTFLTLLTVLLLQQRKVIPSAIAFALSVHFKIYPITYCLPIYFLLDSDFCRDNCNMSNQSSVIPKNWWMVIWDKFCPNRFRVMFVCVFLSIMTTLVVLCYHMYGWDFLHHTYLYHITRTDTRHNFSPYFYLLYLTSQHPRLISLAVFLPQFAVLILVSWRYYRDPILVCFLHTFVFVAFNKVCTSQYFLWYLCYIPLLLPHLKLSLTKRITLPSLWLGGQGLWLLPAYFLEFKGQNTFLWIWLAGLVYFMINIYILTQVISHYCVSNNFQSQRKVVKKVK